MEVYKINLKSHLRNGESIVLGILVCISFPYILGYIKDADAKSFIWISIIMFVVGVLPTVIIHINYYLVNRGDICIYEDGIITIKHKGASTSFNLEDIDRIERHMSFNLAADRVGFAPWDLYNHSIIYLKDKQRFIITSLLVPNLNLPIEGERIFIKRSIYRIA